MTVFDQTFLNTGALGAYLTFPGYDEDPVQPKFDQSPPFGPDGETLVPEKNYITEAINWDYVYRMIFDFFQNFILIILVINMVAGIIIDTFGALKAESQEKEYSLNHECFICEIDREKLDKAYESQTGFLQHIKKDHYLWNYVFFKAYIRFKEKNEFTGNETFIDRQLLTTDVSWFPINKAIKVKNDEDQEDEKKDQNLNNLDQKLENARQIIEQLKKKVKYLN